MSPMLYQWINLIILFSILAMVLKKKLRAYFAEQRKNLELQIQSAGAEYDRIQTEFETIQQSVNQLDQKIAELEKLTNREIENETHRIEEDAKKAIAKISADGEARLKNETERMKKVLEKELFQSALQQAKETLQREMKAQNQEWLAQMVQPEASAGKKNYAS
jgi:F0F1-type ATP synthase membrane subunit b/b'